MNKVDRLSKKSDKFEFFKINEKYKLTSEEINIFITYQAKT